ncbi:MAG: translation initiation factor [Dissulfurispiraceae bacterium]|jgi:translation initiation factor 1
MPDEKSKLVYSTDKAITGKHKPVERTFHQAGVSSGQQRVTVRLDRKGRGGKAVTIIEGLQLSQKQIIELLRQMKSKLGTGGTVKDTSLEIQGDHRDIIISTLQSMGYTPKRAGGH